MKLANRILLLLVCLIFLNQRSSAQNIPKGSVLSHFLEWFEGDFNCQVKNKIDTGETSLFMHHSYLYLWVDEDSTAYIYEEINYLRHEDNIYRQLVWQVKESKDGMIHAAEFLLKKPWLFTGAWHSDDLVRQLNYEYIADQPFCELVFELTDKKYFKGHNLGDGCANHFKKAVRFTTIASLTETQYDYWDRGWAEDGSLAWGNKENGFQFIRKIPPGLKKPKKDDPLFKSKGKSKDLRTASKTNKVDSVSSLR